eukprot:TRINITY_DN11078_c0_g1_i1.p2 TRINITY_DN11078_c0_g1~~TRINITY_DN11078_c0_g1_i1.p2  ORF type:complete len:160 (+),score=22.94 TRINITY_DN11078_c0_g1_i1:3506-3985(+)
MGGSTSKLSDESLKPYIERITQEHESVDDKSTPRLLTKKQLKVSKQPYEPNNVHCSFLKATLKTTSEVPAMAAAIPMSANAEDQDELFLNLARMANVQDSNLVSFLGCQLVGKTLNIGFGVNIFCHVAPSPLIGWFKGLRFGNLTIVFANQGQEHQLER